MLPVTRDLDNPRSCVGEALRDSMQKVWIYSEDARTLSIQICIRSYKQVTRTRGVTQRRWAPGSNPLLAKVRI